MNLGQAARINEVLWRKTWQCLIEQKFHSFVYIIFYQWITTVALIRQNMIYAVSYATPAAIPLQRASCLSRDRVSRDKCVTPKTKERFWQGLKTVMISVSVLVTVTRIEIILKSLRVKKVLANIDFGYGSTDRYIRFCRTGTEIDVVRNFGYL